MSQPIPVVGYYTFRFNAVFKSHFPRHQKDVYKEEKNCVPISIEFDKNIFHVSIVEYFWAVQNYSPNITNTLIVVFTFGERYNQINHMKHALHAFQASICRIELSARMMQPKKKSHELRETNRVANMFCASNANIMTMSDTANFNRTR